MRQPSTPSAVKAIQPDAAAPVFAGRTPQPTESAACRAALGGPFAAFAFLAVMSLAVAASAQTTFNFDGASPLSSPIVSGDAGNFITTNTVARSATKSLKFKDNSPEPFESTTYDLPAGLKTGTVSIWFKENIDQAPALPENTWGLSFILEDASNPADFGAVEISNSIFGPYHKYWASEGSVDRLLTGAGNLFDSNSLPDRNSAIWHQLVFNITPAITTISLDGVSPDEVAAPGSEVSAGVARTLRFRLLGDSPSLGGNKNWKIDTNEPSFPAARSRVYIDDLSVVELTPSALTQTIGFEISGGTPDYDSSYVQSTAPRHDVPELHGFVNRFKINTTAAYVHAGSQSATFDPGSKRERKIAFDLTTAAPGVITLYFYDALGNDQGQNKFGGSIVIQDGIDPTVWLAAEIWNFSFPASSDPTPSAKNYYLTKSTSPIEASFFSRYFGDRSIGWQKVEIYLTAATSRIVVNGLENTRTTDGIQFGPGLDRHPRLLLVADSVSEGGFGNFVNIDELDQVYSEGTADNAVPYVWYDDITLPITPPSAVKDWRMYQ